MLPRLDAEPDQPRGRTTTLVYEAPADSDDPYWAFYEDVAATQLASWLPTAQIRVLDVSGPRTRFARQMVAAGHDVVRVVPSVDRPSPVHGREQLGGPATDQGRFLQVAGDSRSLDWFAPASFDAVLAEGRTLSFCLATETTLEEIYRMLRPGGRLLLCVDSLLLGLARLAEQHRWAELSDVPRADVVLVPAEDGSITRCFWPEELHALLTSAGLDVDWIRPRTVLSAEAVTRAVASDVSCFPTLVRTEVELSAEREGESIGIHLVASARRPG
ncbi:MULTISPECIES: methyltransferase domain-containing protein [unclassified Frankia]|uniref:class I SAM-dependent methyltransferase n=1 Tax=unclassified Frankia TaxID=2632575 RepID=UPI001EF56D7F|nr:MULTISPECIES: methyltransferase domain-containing protein [unclassified Frankia]